MDHRFQYPQCNLARPPSTVPDTPELSEADHNEAEFLKACRHDLSLLQHERELPGIPYYPRVD